MEDDNDVALPEDMLKVREQIAAWRETRKNKRSPMPDTLWDAAVELAHVHGVHVTSRLLGVAFVSLRKRVSATKIRSSPGQGRAAKDGQVGTAPFVEVQPQWVNTQPRCIVELRKPSGVTVTIRVADPRELDIGTLLDSFWSYHQ